MEEGGAWAASNKAVRRLRKRLRQITHLKLVSTLQPAGGPALPPPVLVTGEGGRSMFNQPLPSQGVPSFLLLLLGWWWGYCMQLLARPQAALCWHLFHSLREIRRAFVLPSHCAIVLQRSGRGSGS